MKRIKNILVTTLLAFLMLFTCFSIPSTYALTTVPTTIYYFNDYYPIVTKSEMENQYSGMQVIYDHKWIDSQDFNDMITYNYFTRVPSNSLVIIDIKTFIADSYYLNELFFYLKNEKNCKTMFVSVYDLIDFGDDSFMDYVDSYYRSNFERLRSFLDNIAQDLTYNNASVDGMTIFIDGRLVDTDAYYGYSFEELAEVSPFIRILIEEFANTLPLTDPTDIYGVFDCNGITLLVHSGTEEYTDINHWEIYDYGSVEDFYVEENHPWERVCAIGFSNLESEFYYFLKNGQQYSLTQNFGFLTVYLFEVEPFTVGENSLVVCTGEDLKRLYGEEYSERLAFYEEISDVIDSLLDD